MAGFDHYDFIFPGGVYRKNPLDGLAESIERLDLETPGVPVDDDETGAMVSEAMTEHRKNTYTPFSHNPFRDNTGGLMDWEKSNPCTYVEQINASNIPIYIWSGWYDIYVLDASQWFVNLENPKKLALGLWAHRPPVFNTQERIALSSTEHLRWFDYWLKGVDNGIMEEPAIHYTTKHSEGEWKWRAAEVWPLPEVEDVRFYFSQGPTNTVASVNDGGLVRDAPGSDEGKDSYTTDYTATSGPTSRWNLAEMSYPDMTANDVRALTYTSHELENNVTVTGHPVVTLHVSSTAPDGDFYAYLEEVEASGESIYVSEGVLRASHRAQSEPPFDNMGLPYHRSFEKDLQPLVTGEVATLVFDLLPTSNLFDAGHRIRVTVTCADADNAETRTVTPPPEVTLYRTREHASSITLPIVNDADKDLTTE
jgi:putative CocE/NonD family hydrolase